MNSTNVPIARSSVQCFKIPTATPESDGTATWTHTVMVLVTLDAGGRHGIGYSYADEPTGMLVKQLLKEVVDGQNAFSIPGLWRDLTVKVRNLGRPGIASMAISAIDNALWDLKAKLLGLPLVTLLGASRESIEVYGSGGFTSYSMKQLVDQLTGWAEQGMHMVKMKIGTYPDQDLERVRTVRRALPDGVNLFVDANGAYSRKQALSFAEKFSELGVSWFEEPVTADDLDGLHLIRDRAPAGMDIAAGEYGYTSWYFDRMLAAEAVDVLQADATRCAGISGFMKAAALCTAKHLPFSAHCAPSQHLHACCAAVPARNMEYFYDHVRIETMLFDGFCTPVDGRMHPDLSRPGIGLELKQQDAQKYAA